MNESTDVAVVGAGPYGLSLWSALEDRKVDSLVIGYPFELWRAHMPEGMFLKSAHDGSDVWVPWGGYRLKDFCVEASTGHQHGGGPIALETFVEYSEWLEHKLAPRVCHDWVVLLERKTGAFRLSLRSGASVRARRVVVATGLLPFAYVPAIFAKLPRDLVSHSSEHRDPRAFQGRKVAIVGCGSSALELAALLHEHGAQVELLVRRDGLVFTQPPHDTTSRLAALRWPRSPLCEGWYCWKYYHLEDLFRALPLRQRVVKAYSSFGPSGGWWLRGRVEGRVPVSLSTIVTATERRGERVRLSLTGHRSRHETYDHVIAATGYRVDVARLGYLSSSLSGSLQVASGAPLLNHRFESSVPGLYFSGCMAAGSMGPNMRFLSGTRFASRRLARSL
jgi:hypothetical protein